MICKQLTCNFPIILIDSFSSSHALLHPLGKLREAVRYQQGCVHKPEKKTIKWSIFLKHDEAQVPFSAIGEAGLLPPRERTPRRGVNAGIPAYVIYLVDLKHGLIDTSEPPQIDLACCIHLLHSRPA